MSNTKPHVLIVGGGIGGLTLAQCLRKKGISFEIFERDPDWRTSGWCIYLHSIIPELLAAMPNDMPDLADTNHLFPLDLPSQSVVYHAGHPGQRYGVTSRGLHDMLRADRVMLRRTLSTHLPCQMGKRAVSFEETPDSVTVHFGDGTSATGDILICADGSNSVLRDQLLGKETKPQLLPIATIGGEVTLSGSDFENELRLGHSTRTNFYTEPAEPGLPVINSFCALKKVLPDGRSGEYYWFLIWMDETISDPAHWIKTASPKELHDFVVRTTRGVPREFRNIFDVTPVDKFRGAPFPQRALMLSELPPGRVTVLGDAAHCMPPTRGEAGVHAIKDALKLAECIGAISGDGEELAASAKAAVENYNKEMLPRSQVTVQRNIEASYPNMRSKGWGGRDVEPLDEEHITLETIPRVDLKVAAQL